MTAFFNRRTLMAGLVMLGALAAGCATGRAVRAGQHAQRSGDMDAAVAYYREALSHDPGRVDIRLALERATRAASQVHMQRARQLEEQDQLPGAGAEYRLAADLDPTNALAAAKAIELDRIIRQRIDAARPKSQLDALREQSRRVSPLPQLAVDPRTPLPGINFNQTAVKDAITMITAASGINVTYDAQTPPDAALNRPYTASLSGVSLQDALNQVLGANGLFFKVVDPKTILIALDNTNTRQRLEDQVVQVFYVSHADATEVTTAVQTILNQLNIGTRPVLTPNKTANSIMARASIPVMQVIERLIQANDKPRAEVVIDVEILEVDRKRAASYGLNLSQYQLGFTFSPEAGPSASGGVAPFNLNTVSQGISMADFYLTVPTATIKALESDSRTKVLARPSLRGTEDQAVTLNLGDQIPVPTTTFSAVAAGGIATTPSTSFNLRDVGVNVQMKPHVTYDNEIRIELTVENSAKGPDIQVAGSALPSFSSRKVTTVLRLRDGESNLLAGLLREEDTKSVQGLPGINKIPLLRSLFGGSEKSTTTSDIVMIITPRIVRGHELRAEDLGPIYVGTQQNFGLTGPPALIAPPTAEELAAAAGALAPRPAGGATPPASATPPAGGANQPPAGPPASTGGRAPVVVPVTPVVSAPAPQAAPRVPTIALAVPGALQVGGGPYTLPIQIADASQLSAVTITITYDPKVLKALSAAEGAFLRNGNVTTVFTPKIDAVSGRVDLGITRPAGAAGVSGSGLLGGVIFETAGAGAANLRVTATGAGVNGQAITIQVAPISVVVR